ncbi:MAG: hypothetical protein N2645_15745 [Clostridia bacterium]|nr:hypothetical protein [Clostridia bacterium]
MKNKKNKSQKAKIQKNKFDFTYLYVGIIVIIAVFIPVYLLMNSKDNTNVNSGNINSSASAVPNLPEHQVTMVPTSSETAKSSPMYTLAPKTPGTPKTPSKDFSSEELTKARSLVEKIIFNLNEITSLDPTTAVQDPHTDDNTQNDVSKYTDLLAKIDVDKAVQLIIMLEKDFKGYENAFNEYLLSIQAGLNLDDYTKDRTSYLKAKEDKLKELGLTEIITIDSIENAVIEKIHERNERNRQNNSPNLPNLPQNSNKADPLVPKPEIPHAPNIELNKPKDPLQDIYKNNNPHSLFK